MTNKWIDLNYRESLISKLAKVIDINSILVVVQKLKTDLRKSSIEVMYKINNSLTCKPGHPTINCTKAGLLCKLSNGAQ